jgi:SAM-dependent methyltransferase
VRGSSEFVQWCLSRLPGHVHLNVGSGYPVDSSSSEVFSVDHSSSVLVGSDRAVGADAASLPFKASVFDGVLIKDVLEHVVDPIAVLEEVRRVLTADGRVIVTVPRAIPRAVWSDPTHLRGFTRDSLTGCLSSAGFRIVTPPRRCGSVPGAGRLRLSMNHILTICSIPAFGHYLGTNWFVEAATTRD